jgi:hypothetical protein
MDYNNEVYISVDVETDGPIPGPNSMLSLGAVAFTPDGDELGDFEVNLSQLIEAQPNQDTMEWWKTQPEAWEYCRKNCVHPTMAMSDFVVWVEKFPGKPVFVAYPAGFDFLFVYWYLIYFFGRSPFSHSALDMKTYAMSILNKPYRKSTKRAWPKRWFRGTPHHSHKAIDDAREQGMIFCRMLNGD